MGNDMEMYLEKVLKKNNPEKYIEILEQDREDFAKEIVELNQRIDKAIEYIRKQTHDEDTGNYLGYPDLIDDEHLLNILQGNKWNEVERAYLDDKPIGSDKE